MTNKIGNASPQCNVFPEKARLPQLEGADGHGPGGGGAADARRQVGGGVLDRGRVRPRAVGARVPRPLVGGRAVVESEEKWSVGRGLGCEGKVLARGVGRKRGLNLLVVVQSGTVHGVELLTEVLHADLVLVRVLGVRLHEAVDGHRSLLAQVPRALVSLVSAALGADKTEQKMLAAVQSSLFASRAHLPIGMDINAFAVELAKVTMMIARKLAIDELHITSTQAQWVQEAYTLVFASTLLVFGRLADRFGRRLLFLLGVSIFTVSSVLDRETALRLAVPADAIPGSARTELRVAPDLAVQILAAGNDELLNRLIEYKKKLAEESKKKNESINK